MAGEFCYVELTTLDTEKAKEFYGGMFGWEFSEVQMGPDWTYTTIKTPNGPGGGLFTMPNVPAMWTPYVAVDDIKAATEKAKAMGAEIIRANMEVPGMGWFTTVKDPGGAVISLWEAKK